MSDNRNDRATGHHTYRPEPNAMPRQNGLLTNAKLDAILCKISDQLSSMKKHKRSPLEQEVSSWSDQRSQVSVPTHKSAPTRNNRLETDRSLEDLDPMKQVELGLIYSKGLPNTMMEGNQYFQEIMNLLVDDASESLKSQQLTQDSSSGRTAGKRYEPQLQRKPTIEVKEVGEHPAPTTSNLKQRVHENISKAQMALRHFKQNQELQRMKSSFREGDK